MLMCFKITTDTRLHERRIWLLNQYALLFCHIWSDNEQRSLKSLLKNSEYMFILRILKTVADLFQLNLFQCFSKIMQFSMKTKSECELSF